MNRSIIYGIVFLIIIILLIFPNSIIIYADGKGEDIYQKTYIQKLTGFSADLRPGDLIFCEIWDYLVEYFGGLDIPNGFDHVAMYIGKYYGIDWVVEATYLPIPKVRFTPLFLLKIYSNVTYCSVPLADEVSRKDALNFAVTQLGKPYQHLSNIPQNDPFRWHANYNPYDPVDPYSDCWYCAELVWASYYQQGIDLDPVYPESRPNNYLEGYGYLRFVSPQNIFNSDNSTGRMNIKL